MPGSTYDLSKEEPKDTVRLLISDVGGADGSSFLYTDEELERFIALAPEEDLRLAAAQALRAIAGNEAQVSKRIKFLELSTDGPAVAKALLETADKYEEEAEGDAEIEIATMSCGIEDDEGYGLWRRSEA
jgi:hypothetical protein